MKAHLTVKLRAGAPVHGDPPHWTDLIEEKSLAPDHFHDPIDRLLAARRVNVWSTREFKPRAAQFSRDEIESGLNRVYRLILQHEGRFPADLVESISLLPTVEYVRPGRIGVAELPRPEAASMSRAPGGAARDAIHLDQAHAFTRGDESVTVAVLDTGVHVDHPELRDAIAPGRDFVNIIDGADRFVGDYLDADTDAEDEVGHGTHVAGIVAGRGSDMPPGVVPRCRILPVRVLGALERDGRRFGAGLIDNINVGIKWAVDQGAQVLNMSLGVEPTGRELPHEEVIDYARRRGVTVVAASGNDGALNRYFPGALPYAVTVGATDAEGEVAMFSTYGDQVDLVAPGTEIYSSYLNGRYAFSSGTSQATPFVAGAAAMLHSLGRAKGGTVTDSRIKYVLKNTSDRVDRRFRNPRAGYGRLNLIDAVRLLDHKLD